MYLKYSNPKKGFTLLELIVSIAIIGILSAVAATSYTNVQRSSRDARRKGDLKAVQQAIETFYQRNNVYPSTNDAWWGTCVSYGSHADTGANGYVPNLAPDFIPVLPHDPRESVDNIAINASCFARFACYMYRSDGTDYKLVADCTPENAVPITDSLYDPVRPAWAFQLSSTGNIRNTW